MKTVKQAAADYIAKGLRVLPLKPGTKEPYDTGWNTSALVYAPEDFNENDNIGIRSVEGLVVVDLDCAEAVAMADAFLPRTGLIWGRESKPKAKRAYLSTLDKTLVVKNEQGKTLVELRVNHQDVAPPSLHESGERLQHFGPIGEPASCAQDDLLRKFQLLGVASLVAQRYPAEGWHDRMLALAGLFRHLGLTEDEALTILRTVCTYKTDPLKDEHVVRSTYKRAEGAAFKGEKALVKATSEGFVDALKDVFGLRYRTAEGFERTDKGFPDPASMKNVELALTKLKAAPTFNAFRERHMITRGDAQPVQLDDAQLRAVRKLIYDRYFRVAKDFFIETILTIGDEHRFHPVLDYLRGLIWDQKPRLDTWLIRHGHANDTPYVRAVSALPLLAAVKRVVEPGAKFDEMLILEGPQGKGKSTSLKALCPRIEWFCDDLPLDLGSKEIIERTSGKWIIEAAELQGRSKAQIDKLKGMLSRTDDTARGAYERLARDVPRQWVLIGTTNKKVYLVDPSGNRRFWPVFVPVIDAVSVRGERDQLWAEAYARITAGESIRLAQTLWADARKEQEARRAEDPWEDILRDRIDLTRKVRLTWPQVWQLVEVPVDRQTDDHKERLRVILRRMGLRLASVRDKSTKRVLIGWAYDPGLPFSGAEDGDNEVQADA